MKPWLSLLVVLLTLGLATGIGVYLWTSHLYQLALQATEEEKYTEAREHIQNYFGLSWWPSTEALFLAARLERLNGDLLQAEKFLERCNQSQGGASAKTQLEALLIRAEAGYFGELEANLWNTVRAEHPDSAQILRTLTKVYVYQSRVVPALKALEQWLKINPQSGEALEWQGLLYSRINNVDEALISFEKMIQVAPHRNNGRFHFAQSLLLNNNVPEALVHLRYLLKESPNNPEYIEALARCKFLEGEFDEARQLFDQALTHNPKNAETMYYRAKLEYQDGKFAVAEDWLRKSLEIDPYNIYGHFLLSESLNKQISPAKKKEAQKHFARYKQLEADANKLTKLLTHSLESSQGHPDVLSEIGAIYLRTGKEDAGLLWLTKALSRDPRHKATHDLLADYYQKKKQPKLAAKHQQLAKESAN